MELSKKQKELMEEVKNGPLVKHKSNTWASRDAKADEQGNYKKSFCTSTVNLLVDKGLIIRVGPSKLAVVIPKNEA